jgi:hypothetical protein
LPYISKLNEVVQNGFIFHAAGQLTSNPYVVEFNLVREKGGQKDYIFHLSIRFYEGLFVYKAIYNDMINGTWSPIEERTEHPWSESAYLDLRVRVLDDSYAVYGNGKFLKSFKQRVPANETTHVEVKGGLKSLDLLNYGRFVWRRV